LERLLKGPIRDLELKYKDSDGDDISVQNNDDFKILQLEKNINNSEV